MPSLHDRKPLPGSPDSRALPDFRAVKNSRARPCPAGDENRREEHRGEPHSGEDHSGEDHSGENHGANQPHHDRAGAGSFDTAYSFDPAGPFDEQAVASLARALGHPARVRILLLLLQRSECVGCDIVDDAGLAQSTISEHLRLLKQAGLVTAQPSPPHTCYRLNGAVLAPLIAMLQALSRSPNAPSEADPCNDTGSICFRWDGASQRQR